MKLQTIKKFFSDDFPDLPELFLSNLNAFVDVVVAALDGRLDFNNFGQKWGIEIPAKTKVDSSNPYRLNWQKSSAPFIVLVGKASIKGAGPAITIGASVTAEWEYDPTSRVISIKKLNGLTVDGSQTNTYLINLCGFE